MWVVKWGPRGWRPSPFITLALRALGLYVCPCFGHLILNRMGWGILLG